MRWSAGPKWPTGTGGAKTERAPNERSTPLSGVVSWVAHPRNMMKYVCLYTRRYIYIYIYIHTLHFTLYTSHSTLYTPHFTLYTPHFTLHTPHSTLHTLHSTLYTCQWGSILASLNLIVSCCLASWSGDEHPNLNPQPASSQPGASQQPASQPASSQPAASQPASSQPAARQQPASSQPASSQPAASQPASSQPAASQQPDSPRTQEFKSICGLVVLFNLLVGGGWIQFPPGPPPSKRRGLLWLAGTLSGMVGACGHVGMWMACIHL